jgi:hypothetical protein
LNELALMDIDDLAGVLPTVTTVLRRGGWFVASIVHPCIPGGKSGGCRSVTSRLGVARN